MLPKYLTLHRRISSADEFTIFGMIDLVNLFMEDETS